MPKFSAYMKGSDGSQGPAGASIIDGILVNEDSLPQQAGHGKHAYLVGTTDPKNLWVWDEENSEWKDQGPIANRIGEVTATMNAIPWTTTAIPSVQTQFSTSNQIDSLNFDFTIPFLDNAYDVINNKVNRDGDTMTGDLIISQSSSLHIQQPGNVYTNSNFSIGRTAKTYIGNTYNSSGYTRTGIIQENSNGNKEYFRLPISYSTENNNTYDILTNKALVTVEQGGTGVSTATANYVFAAPTSNNGSPSFRQLVANDIPNLNASKITDGILPIERGGTNANTSTQALVNLGAVAKSGDTMTGNLTLQNGKMLLLENSVSTGLQLARIYLRSGNVSHGNNVTVWYNDMNSHGNQLYYLPAYDETLNSANYYYKILTSKEPVAIGEGGTGATTAADARANLNVVSKDGDIISGTVTFFQPGNSYTNSILCVGRSSKTYIGNSYNSSGYTRTGIIQENSNGNKEYFRLPISYSTENDNTYDILTSKDTITVAQGGTGKTTHTANAILTGNGTSAINNVATASGAFYATAANGTPSFGTLPIAQGGTGATTAVDAITNLGAVNKTGDIVTGQLFIQQPVNYTSNTTQMNFAIGRTAKTYIVNNGYSGGSTFTAIVQEHPTGGAHEEFRLPTSYSTENNNTYNILTSKTPVTLEQGGTGGTDSGWKPYTNSSVFTGTIYYRKVGAFFMIQAQQINVVNEISAGGYVKLMTLSSVYRPVKEIMPSCFINTGIVNNRIVPMRLTTGGELYLYANKTDAITSSYNLYFSGFGFM